MLRVMQVLGFDHCVIAVSDIESAVTHPLDGSLLEFVSYS
jgi:hypothetical protein